MGLFDGLFGGLKETAELTCEQARQIMDEISARNGIITNEDQAVTLPAILKAL